MAGIYVNTNLMAIDAHIQMGKAQDSLQVSLRRLASGLRINTAADDASGLAISEKMRAQIRGLHRATLNAQDGISLLQTAEGALKEVHGILQRMRELAVQASNETLTATDRVEIQKEVQQLKEEIDRISRATEFNTKKLLNGDAAALWSTDRPGELDAIIRSNAIEGNFKLEVKATPGKNQILKSDIFTIKEGVLSIGLSEPGSSAQVESLSDPYALPKGSYQLDLYSAGYTQNASGAATDAYIQEGGWTLNGVNVTATSNGTDGYVIIKVLSSDKASNGVSIMYQTVTQSAGTSDWTTGTLDSNGAFSISKFGKIDFSQGATLHAGDVLIVAFSNSTVGTDGGIRVAYTSGKPLSPIWDVGDEVSTGVTEVTYASVDDAGNILIGNFKVHWTEGAIANGKIMNGTTDNPIFQVLEGGDVAIASTRLRDIAKFYDADGNFILSTPQKLTIWNGSKSYDIYLDGNDTIGEVADKIKEAILDGLDLKTTDPDVNEHIAEFISTALGNKANTGEAAVEGTIVIRSPLTGEAGELTFSGDENLMKALSLETVQEAENTQINVKVYDAHNLTFIGSDTVSDGTLRGVIQGVDVKFDPGVGVNITWDSTQKTFTFTGGEKETFYLHIVDNSLSFHIGANQNQTMDTSIGRMDTVALGIDDLLVVDIRHAEQAITKVDRAIQTVSSERGKIGAVINRLQKTISNLNVQRENMIASESRIRDLDMASETTNLTKSQILSQTAMAMLAQANQIPQQVLQLLR